MLSRRVKFFPFNLAQFRIAFAFVLRGDWKKNRAFTEKFFEVRAYTLRCNHALSLSRPNPKNEGNPLCVRVKMGYVGDNNPACFLPPSLPIPKAEDPQKSKNAFRGPYSGQIDPPHIAPYPHPTKLTQTTSARV